MSHDYSQQMSDDEAIQKLIAQLNGGSPAAKVYDNSPRRFAPEPERNFKVCPALCLDLDGTVRYSASGEFINGPDDVRLFDDVEAKIWEYRDKGYIVFGISNQGGVAHGFKSASDNDQEIEATFAAFNRNPFHIIKCCYHDERGKVAPYNHRSLLRKPDYGMLSLCEVEAFQAGYIVDWDNSLMVGDRAEDQHMALNAKINFQWAYEFFGREQP